MLASNGIFSINDALYLRFYGMDTFVVFNRGLKDHSLTFDEVQAPQTLMIDAQEDVLVFETWPHGSVLVTPSICRFLS
jgi:hypothetical protein